MKWKKFVEDAKADPGRFYRQPSDVVRDRRLSNEERLAILEAWERDARALLIAADENMSGGESSELELVIKARMEIEKTMEGAPLGDAKGNREAHR
jgi:hypothetical protein